MFSHLIWTEMLHFSTSLLAAGIGYMFYRTRHKKKKPISPLWFVALGIGFGFFIDLDHLFDYWLAYPWQFNWFDFARGVYVLKNDKLFLPLHALEWGALLLLAVPFIKSLRTKSIVLTIALAMTFHIVGDVYTNNMHKYAYFMTYRIANNFRFSAMLPPEAYQRDQKIRERLFPDEYR